MRPRHYVPAIATLIALALAGWQVKKVVALEALVDATAATTADDIERAVGAPDRRSNATSTYLGLGPCIAIDPRCRTALWYSSPCTWCYPAHWLFGFDERGQLVTRYRYASP